MSQSDFLIRRAQETDVASIIKLYAEGSGRTLDETRLTGYIANQPSAVALRDGQLVGFGFCVPFAPDITELGNLFVDHAYRSHGIGSRLLASIEAAAVEKFHSIVLSNSMHYTGVREKRPATSFYIKNGYSQIWTTGLTNVFAKQISSTTH